ncbi:Gfo/Idh/MocA family protein [Syntrophorhabdus aromaticivorans]|uniref:Gfo/Idh/MocA family oxidoreductase n=1 Tax=Syntrophorhabdus aromaticivorans TaxID=328301 RepID=A0A971RZQ9_9BACT|nr:Gfo/Idh/MocA family oxidoreductase [Syntrophorhabdus aromaticivorans]NLW34520.1 Gfo/Idh/MocA family oxidoreductase [Syntrophorhabdus aromaticivorans]
MPLRMVLVGAGHMGKIHVDKLASFADVHIAGIVDADAAMARDVAQKYGVPWFGDYKELLGHVEGIVIASPTETHYRIARDFLEAGSHVFIEKPIAKTREEAAELVDLARKAKRVLQIGHLERFNPAFTGAAPFIKKPVLIETRRASGFTGRSIDIDVVLDLMIHDIDLVLSLVDGEVKRVRAQGFSLVTDNLDAASAQVEFANGCIANLTANRISAVKERSLTVFQKDRYIFVDLLNGKITNTVKQGEGLLDTTEYTAKKLDAVKHELMAFIQSIATMSVPIVKGEDGLRALALAHQIKEYIAEKQFQ